MQKKKQQDNILGLKDKNGKEIYEGDIVKVFTNKEWRIGKIIYEHSGFTIDVTNNKELEYGRTSIIENLTEVIGNIYDNKNLLEKGEKIVRDIFKVLEQIKEALGEDNEYSEIKAGIDDIEYSLRFKAPEDTWNYVYDRLIINFIPPQTEIDYKVLSIWTTKTVEELKEGE